MKKTSLRWKTVTFLLVLVALAFIIGIVLCAVFSTRFFVSLKQRSLVDLYEMMNSDIPSEELAEDIYGHCEEEGITLLVKDYSGRVVYSFGHSDTMSRRLDDITFGEHDIIDRGQEIVSENQNYTLQVVNNRKDKKASYIEIWGFLDDGNSFIARSSLSTIQSNIRISLGFFSIVCAAILIIAAIAIYFIISYYSKPIVRLAAFAKKVNEGDFGSL